MTQTENSEQSTDKPDYPSVDDFNSQVTKVWSLFRERFLIKHFGNTYNKIFRMEYSLLAEAIENAHVDLKRMATWHLDKNLPDNHKYAAFISKWIAKTRPIQVRNPLFASMKAKLKTYHSVNAYLAFWVFRSFLDAEQIPKSLSRHFVYIFHFRDEKGETLSILAFAAEELNRLERRNQSLEKALKEAADNLADIGGKSNPAAKRAKRVLSDSLIHS